MKGFFELLTVAMILCAHVAAAQEDVQDYVQGERLYEAHCAICHSFGGTGGRGPRLDVAKLRRAGVAGRFA